MEFEDILYENRNGVAWITINRPEKMNALDPAHYEALSQAGRDAVIALLESGHYRLQLDDGE